MYISCMYIENTFLRVYYRSLYYNLYLPGFGLMVSRSWTCSFLRGLVESYSSSLTCVVGIDKSVRGLVESLLCRWCTLSGGRERIWTRGVAIFFVDVRCQDWQERAWTRGVVFCSRCQDDMNCMDSWRRRWCTCDVRVFSFCVLQFWSVYFRGCPWSERETLFSTV